MTKPIAIVKGGIDSLINLFAQKRSEAFFKTYAGTIFGISFTIVSIG